MKIKLHYLTNESTDSSQSGNKFVNLQRISKYLKVPPPYSLKSNAFKACLLGESLNTIKERMQLLRTNGGYQLGRIQKEIEREINNITLISQVKEELDTV